ncbi:MAG: hypothetical protein IKC32_06070 [Clostridia bacterium]|nr:hypothetical protein [Clostridia bacterium]
MKTYVISDISGEYATLKDVDSGEELFIAMALLPLGVDVGDKLAYTFPDFTLLDK